jgi:hypothetical protein
VRLAEGITQVEMVLRDAACALQIERERERERQREAEKALQKETERQRNREISFQTQSLQLVDEYTRERLAWHKFSKVKSTVPLLSKHESSSSYDIHISSSSNVNFVVPLLINHPRPLTF